MHLLYRSSIIYITPSILFVIGFYVYLNQIYPFIPHELGGARPRCAYLDLNTTDFSIEALKGLGVARSTHEPMKVDRSERLRIHFNGSAVIIVSTTSGQKADARLWEINKPSIKAIEWCS